MIDNIRQSILFALANAQAIDFLAYSWVLLALIFLIFVSVFLASKTWWQFGFLLILFSVIAFFIGIYYVNLELNEQLRPVSISKIYKKQLKYSNSLLIDFNITNKSHKTLNICKIYLGFYLGSANKNRNFINSLNPFAKKTIILDEVFKPSQTIQVKEFVDDFAFIDYNITKKAECF
ncbi:DUF2393 family protein [Campylobacter sp. faydin G-140]|uniref:DUF2393 family protein n=1 Tax=Campylobacter anatolicus TaxID=2829105 RepID=UPI001B9B0993|nr:DUF2393 family protein [Campylobacter anatolicus]MBR8462364.1 DUF2393 family protein [Campylobacter anatolicus]MBR8465498.1 DUF2393 family protein [Campylobacter anatolicus]